VSAETVAVAALLAAAPVTTLVGDRIYPDFVAIEKDLPAIAIARSATEHITTIHTAAPLGAFASLEVWCQASSRAATEDLATKAIAALAPVAVEVVDRIPEFVAESEVYATVVIVTILE
jgi:hypothetical protein